MRTLILMVDVLLGLSTLSRQPLNFHRGPWAWCAAWGYHFLGQYLGYCDVSWLRFASLYEKVSKTQKFSRFLSRDISMQSCLTHRLPMTEGARPIVFSWVQHKIRIFTFRFWLHTGTCRLPGTAHDHDSKHTSFCFQCWDIPECVLKHVAITRASLCGPVCVLETLLDFCFIHVHAG
jgi:hypothetical protein